MRRVSWAVAVLVTMLIGLAPELRAAGYTYTSIDNPKATTNGEPSFRTSVFGINNLGQIVGSYEVISVGVVIGIAPSLIPSISIRTHGFQFDNGAFTTIDAPTGPD